MSATGKFGFKVVAPVYFTEGAAIWFCDAFGWEGIIVREEKGR
jgi:hypothetical protein